MPKFSTISLMHLEQVAEPLVVVAKMAIEIIDFRVTCGHRSRLEQMNAYHNGTSTKKWPDSYHNRLPSEAFDFAPWPINWKDHERFVYVGGVIVGVARSHGINVIWGGDWDSDGHIRDHRFIDRPHIQLVT